MTIIGQDRETLWYQPNGLFTSWDVYGIGEKAGGMTGKTVPGPGTTPVYGRTAAGAPVAIKINKDAPGDLPNATITLYERGQIDFLLAALQDGCPINIQTRASKCGALNNPTSWDTLQHWAYGTITSYNPGDGPSVEYSGTAVQPEASVSFLYYIKLVATQLSGLTTTETENLLSIAGLGDADCNECGSGYPGADKVLYIGAAGGGAAEANLLYSADGGGTWAATSNTPYSAGDYQDLTYVEVFPISTDQFRVVVGTGTTIVGNKAQIAYGDAQYGNEGGMTWTVVDVDQTSTGDVVESLFWPFLDRLYIAAAGDIYVSTDQGETADDAAIYTGANAINGWAISPDGTEVWAVGATNTILREIDQNGVFSARVGPSGGGDFTAVAIAQDGTLFAGNGTKLYKTRNKALNAGGWDQIKDFGTNKVVKSIQCIGGDKALGGDSQLIRVVVDDTTGAAAGGVYLSVDGGNSFQQLAGATSNLGLNDAYFGKTKDNYGIIVGDAVGGVGQIYQIVATST